MRHAVPGVDTMEVAEGRVTPDDRRWMLEAIDLAHLGWGQVSPNPLVGAVIVREGQRVGAGAHRRFGGPHAEVEAIREAGDRARNATLYCVLEPCAHHGKTPPCVDAIIEAGLARVVVGVRDPNPEARGGVERLLAAGIRVDVGAIEEAAAELNASFLHAFGSSRPWVTLKLAISLDGAIAGARGTTSWLTGPPARQRVHHLRAGYDAIAVGMGTVLADDPLLTVRDASPPRVPPVRVIFSRQGRLPLTSRLAQRTDEAPVVVFGRQHDPSYENALRALGVEPLSAKTLPESLAVLRGRGIQSLLVEGGASLTAAFLAADLVDRVILFQAPIVLGKGSLPAFGELADAGMEGLRLRLLHNEYVGDDHMMVFATGGR